MWKNFKHLMRFFGKFYRNFQKEFHEVIEENKENFQENFVEIKEKILKIAGELRRNIGKFWIN